MSRRGGSNGRELARSGRARWLVDEGMRRCNSGRNVGMGAAVVVVEDSQSCLCETKLKIRVRTARKRGAQCHMAGMSREERRAEIGEAASMDSSNELTSSLTVSSWKRNERLLLPHSTRLPLVPYSTKPSAPTQGKPSSPPSYCYSCLLISHPPKTPLLFIRHVGGCISRCLCVSHCCVLASRTTAAHVHCSTVSLSARCSNLGPRPAPNMQS